MHLNQLNILWILSICVVLMSCAGCAQSSKSVSSGYSSSESSEEVIDPYKIVVRPMRLSPDEINKEMEASLKSEIQDGIQLSPSYLTIKVLLDEGAEVRPEYIALYLNNRSITPELRVVRMLAEKGGYESLNYYYRDDSWIGGKHIPVLILIIERIPEFLPEALKWYRVNPNVQAYIEHEKKITDENGVERSEITKEYFETPLMKALADPDKVKLLLDCKAMADQVTSRGETALMFAVQEEYLKSVQLLIEAGADVNHVDDYGNSVLMYSKWDRITELLKAKGAKLKPKVKKKKAIVNPTDVNQPNDIIQPSHNPFTPDTPKKPRPDLEWD